MDKTTQNLIWSCLPHEYKKEVKRQYRIAINGNQYFTQCTLEYLFGYHNLTSDAEGEEMLTVPKSKIQELYRNYCAECDNEEEGSTNRISLGGRLAELMELFGSKCLPDEEPKPAEPKFKRCKKVITPSGEVCIIEDTHFENGCWLCLVGDPARWIPESDLEPYTEPDTSHETSVCESHSGNTSQKEINMNSNRNLSQETVNCDKQFDNILKDNFSKERKLNIAAMAMQGILSNPQLLKITIETYQEEIGSPDIFVAVAKAAKAQADALIAESEKGGKG